MRTQSIRRGRRWHLGNYSLKIRVPSSPPARFSAEFFVMIPKRPRDDPPSGRPRSVVFSEKYVGVKTMRRRQPWQELSSDEERARAACTLTLLSSSPPSDATKRRAFTCKTCNRSFPTFQALGGHRTSHNRPSVRRAGGKTEAPVVKRQTVHKCRVCKHGFAAGQALSGHMRRHRTSYDAEPAEGDGSGDCGGELCLNLSLSLPDAPVGFLNLGLGLGF